MINNPTRDIVDLFDIMAERESFYRLIDRVEQLCIMDSLIPADKTFHQTDRIESCARFLAWEFLHATSSKRDHRVRRDTVLAVRHRLRRVRLEFHDWHESIKKHDAPGTLFYVSPPPSNSIAEEVATALATVKGMVVLHGGPFDAFVRLEQQGWVRASMLRGDTQVQKPGRPSLWLSPAAGAQKNSRQVQMQRTAYLTHHLRVMTTESRVMDSINRMREIGKFASIAEVSRDIGMSREHLSRQYRYLFEAQPLS